MFRRIASWLRAFAWALPVVGAASLARAQGGPPPAVVVAAVAVRNVAPTHSYIGRVQAIQTVNLVARVSAFVEKIDFQEGGMVKAGQTLFELQKGPYQAALDQAQAALQGAEATLRNAQIVYQRDTRLVAGTVVSQAQIDSDAAARDADAANVAAARAGVETAAINLSYTTIVSPIDGRVGRAQYTVGNLVGPGGSTGALATVVQVDPMRVVFSVADSDIVAILQKTHQTQTQIGQSALLRLQLPDGQSYAPTGSIEFINNQVDPSTGTVEVWGRFPNQQGLLIPGGFVTVDVSRAQPQLRPLVPVQAVQNDKSGDFVLLVGPDHKVREQKITTGRQLGQDWIVTAGLSGGEDVIVQGQQKVKTGETVSPTTQAGGGATSAAGLAAASQP